MAYTITPARYAGRWNGKPQVVVRCPSDTMFKTRAARLIGDGLKGRYSGRERGYVVSPAKAAKFEKLFAAGFDASTWDGKLIEPARVAA